MLLLGLREPQVPQWQLVPRAPALRAARLQAAQVANMSRQQVCSDDAQMEEDRMQGIKQAALIARSRQR